MSTRLRKISFNFETLSFEGITVNEVKFWEKCYPDVDVVGILTKSMPAWFYSNPSRAHKKQWRRFINGWLSRQQESTKKGGFKREAY